MRGKYILSSLIVWKACPEPYQYHCNDYRFYSLCRGNDDIYEVEFWDHGIALDHDHHILGNLCRKTYLKELVTL